MNNIKWKYGNSWEKYPIEENEIWQCKNSKIIVRDIRKKLPTFIKNVDLIYCDPPWNLANANSYITKACFNSYIDYFPEFYIPFFNCIENVKAKVVYVEIGKQKLEIFLNLLSGIYPIVDYWKITYYKRNICFLLRGAYTKVTYDYNGCDDINTPLLAIQNEKNSNVVLDLCTGKGLTGLAAYKENKTFYGLELNKRRLACFIDKLKGIYKYAYTIS